MKKELQQLLADTLNIFHQDPSQRSLIKSGGDMDCVYNGLDNRHCFVGHLMPEEAKQQGLDLWGNSGIGVSKLIGYCNEKGWTPNKLEQYPLYILHEFQHIHDNNSYWGMEGLNTEGQAKLKDICDKNDLDFEIFEQTLGL